MGVSGWALNAVVEVDFNKQIEGWGAEELPLF